jgi:cell division protein FtsB
MVADFKKKKNFAHSVLPQTILGILVVAAIVFLVYSNIKISEKRARLTEQLQSLKEQVQELEERKRELQAGVSYQGSEEYLEEVARERLNLKAEGEEVVAFLTQENENKEDQEESKGIVDRILETLKFW